MGDGIGTPKQGQSVSERLLLDGFLLLHVSQPIVLAYLFLELAIGGKEYILAQRLLVVLLPVGLSDFPLKDNLRVKLDGKIADSPGRVDSGFVIVPQPDHGEGLPAPKVYADAAVLFEWRKPLVVAVGG